MLELTRLYTSPHIRPNDLINNLYCTLLFFSTPPPPSVQGTKPCIIGHFESFHQGCQVAESLLGRLFQNPRPVWDPLRPAQFSINQSINQNK
jgi:hypothetical protein